MRVKKIIICLVLMILLTGCGNKDVKLNLSKIETDLNELTVDDSKLLLDNEKLSMAKLQDKYGMNTDIFDEILVSTPSKVGSASMYAIFLPKEGKESECEEEIDKFFDKYSQAWTMGYFPEEEKLVENKTEDKYGNYYIFKNRSMQSTPTNFNIFLFVCFFILPSLLLFFQFFRFYNLLI